MIERHHLRNTASANSVVDSNFDLNDCDRPPSPDRGDCMACRPRPQFSRERRPRKLVQLVRDATKQFADVNAATAAGYQPFLGCVSGPDHGAMGNHYVNGALVGDGELDASRPEVLIYEPSGDGLRLVGVEFVVIADTWLAKHDSPPMLEGQTFQYVSSPNRYGLPAHFELHVWAWRDNPGGAFVDWNNNVTCEGQIVRGSTSAHAAHETTYWPTDGAPPIYGPTGMQGSQS